MPTQCVEENLSQEGIELHRIQHAFRAVMDAMASPGTLETLPLCSAASKKYPGLGAAAATLVDMLIDQAVTFLVAGEFDGVTKPLTKAIAEETRAKTADIRKSEYIVIPKDTANSSIVTSILEAPEGSLVSPEKGATIIIECSRLADTFEDAQDCKETMHAISLCGPGIENTNTFFVDSLVWARARASRDDEFPCGLDFLLVDLYGDCVAIPRTSHVRFNEGGNI